MGWSVLRVSLNDCLVDDGRRTIDECSWLVSISEFDLYELCAVYLVIVLERMFT